MWIWRWPQESRRQKRHYSQKCWFQKMEPFTSRCSRLVFISALRAFCFYGLWAEEMRPAAETIDPDDCIISRYLRAHKTPLPRVGEGPEGPPRPLTPLEQRAKTQNGVNDFRVTRAFSVSSVRLFRISCAWKFIMWNSYRLLKSWKEEKNQQPVRLALFPPLFSQPVTKCGCWTHQ